MTMAPVPSFSVCHLLTLVLSNSPWPFFKWEYALSSRGGGGGKARFYKDVNASTPFSIRLMVFIEHLLASHDVDNLSTSLQGEGGSPFSFFSPLDSMRM